MSRGLKSVVVGLLVLVAFAEAGNMWQAHVYAVEAAKKAATRVATVKGLVKGPRMIVKVPKGMGFDYCLSEAGWDNTPLNIKKDILGDAVREMNPLLIKKRGDLSLVRPGDEVKTPVPPEVYDSFWR